MLKGFLLLPFVTVIPVIAPLWAPIGNWGPDSRAQVGEVALPELSPQQWRTLLQQQGTDHQRLHIDLGLGVDYGRVFNVTVRNGTGYSDIDRSIAHWIAANWKLAPWFVGHEGYVVSFDVDPSLRRIVFSK